MYQLVNTVTIKDNVEMTVNRGKEFEKIVQTQLEEIPNTSVIRLYDTMQGFVGICNPCDYIIYKEPTMFLFECKAKGSNTLNFKNDIRGSQWDGLEKHSLTKGVIAGVLCWFTEKDITRFYPIEYLLIRKNEGAKSVNSDEGILVDGHKKKIFFKYDWDKFFREVLLWRS